MGRRSRLRTKIWLFIARYRSHSHEDWRFGRRNSHSARRVLPPSICDGFLASFQNACMSDIIIGSEILRSAPSTAIPPTQYNCKPLANTHAPPDVRLRPCSPLPASAPQLSNIELARALSVTFKCVVHQEHLRYHLRIPLRYLDSSRYTHRLRFRHYRRPATPIPPTPVKCTQKKHATSFPPTVSLNHASSPLPTPALSHRPP
ncbi:hypothetical protein OF83DRAFT_1288625 [Amylostereum chailletii]|nr:hypothetical protein OF83DRAFT_1288625 [Amylostereum chailletii]